MEGEILIAIDLLKNSGESNYDLLKRFDQLYNKVKIRNSTYCQICEEWLVLEMPVDCLCKPIYCIRNENDTDFIMLYEQLNNSFHH